MKYIGDRIRNLRKKKGYTIEGFAKKLDMSYPGYQRIETTGNTTISTLQKIGKALNVDISHFISEKKYPENVNLEIEELLTELNHKIKRVDELEDLYHFYSNRFNNLLELYLKEIEFFDDLIPTIQDFLINNFFKANGTLIDRQYLYSKKLSSRKVIELDEYLKNKVAQMIKKEETLKNLMIKYKDIRSVLLDVITESFSLLTDEREDFLKFEMELITDWLELD